MSATQVPVNAELLNRLCPQFKQGVEEFVRQLEDLQTRIPSDAIAEPNSKLHEQTAEALAASVDLCREYEERIQDDEPFLRAAQAYFRWATEGTLGQSWFAHRARTKPSGFPGDYDMLLKIYQRATPARGLGSYLDLVLMDVELARAVRGRLKAVREFLIDELRQRDGQGRLLDVASGPCQEFLDWPLKNESIEVLAMDSDPAALEYVQSTIAPAVEPMKFDAVRYNALRTRKAEATIRNFGRFDIMYSVGLADYLTDELLVDLLAAWHDTLHDDGVMYIAFKDTERYDKTPYQWHLDWFFYQRTVGDVLQLYHRAGFDVDRIQTWRDESGIIVNFVTRVAEHPRRRTDAAHANVRPSRRSAAARETTN
ncbi:MAG: hypothetical protein KatS3mg111_4048 [Pirellulaceae bacterium]|nr:MAG: hypothetical protein KatS3mg111_4048 [Pirellulaceae bacterium]